jgi:hypothetical protein
MMMFAIFLRVVALSRVFRTGGTLPNIAPPITQLSTADMSHNDTPRTNTLMRLIKLMMSVTVISAFAVVCGRITSMDRQLIANGPSSTSTLLFDDGVILCASR